MRCIQVMRNLVCESATLLLLLFGVLSLSGQPKAPHPGILLFEQGKHAEAVSTLEKAKDQAEYKADSAIWNYLGLSYIEINDYTKARKALEKAVELSPDNSIYTSNLAHVYLLFKLTNTARLLLEKAITIDPSNVAAYYLRGSASLRQSDLDDAEKDADRVVAIDPAYPRGYILKSDILMARLGKQVAKGSTVEEQIKFLAEAADILKEGLEKAGNSLDRQIMEDQFEAVESFYNHFSKEGSGFSLPGLDPEPGVTGLKIIRKPRPGYTDSARLGNVQGTIKLAVLFGANGKVKCVMLLNRLGNGLDQEAVNAARRIEFEPMTKNGKPVSVVRITEYTFSIY